MAPFIRVLVYRRPKMEVSRMRRTRSSSSFSLTASSSSAEYASSLLLTVAFVLGLIRIADVAFAGVNPAADFAEADGTGILYNLRNP